MLTLKVSLAFLAASLVAPSAFAQWPAHTGAPQNFTSPAIADINGDGALEVVFGGWDGRLHCVDASGHELWNLLLSNDPDTPGYDPQLASSPTLVDLDGDPSTLEIVIGSGNGNAWGRLYVISSTGHVLATFDTPSQIWTSPLVVDTDGDGIQEIYFGAAFAPYPYYGVDVHHSAGSITLVPRWQTFLTEGGSMSAAAAGHLLGGNTREIVVAAGGAPNTDIGGKKIYAYRSDGTLLWTYATERFNNLNSPVIVDLDGDGQTEVLQASTDGYLYCLNGATGTLRWRTHGIGEGSFLQTPAVADLDGDGQYEIVIGYYRSGGFPNSLYCLRANGTFVWSRTFTDTTLAFSSPSIGSLNGDGNLSIVIGTSKEGGALHSYVRAFDRFGNDEWVASQPGGVYSSPALVDLDGDGTLEVCFGIYNGTYNCLRSNGQQFQFSPVGPLRVRRPWPMLNQNIQNHRVAKQ